MPATVSHALSMTTPDNPAYENQPQHWNSEHAVSLSVLATEISGLFSNKNGVSFGLDGTNITGSIAAGGAPGSVSAGTTNVALGEVVFSNSNGVSFGLDGATVTATVQTNYLTTAMASNRGSDFVQATAAFAGTSASGTIASNGISVSIGPYITTAMLSNAATISNIRLSAGTTSNLASAFTFADGSGISFGLNAGTITGTVKTDYLTTAALSNHSHGASGANGSFAFQTLSFSNANGVSFGTSAGSAITASHNALTTAMASNRGSDFVQATAAFAGTNASGTIASNGISVSVAAPGAAAENNWHHALGANTAGNTTASGSTIGLSGINLTISGTNNSVLNLSVPATSSLSAEANITIGTTGSTIGFSVAAPGGGTTLSGFDGYANNEFLAIAGGQASLWLDRLDLQAAMQFDRVGLRITHSNATNSSGSATISAWVGFYTRNASSLSLLASTSFSTGITQSGTVGSYSRYGGIKILPVPWTTTFDAGNYWVGLITRTTTGGANMTFGNLANSQIASTMSGFFGSASAATNQIRIGVGVYSATTSGLPSGISITQINGNSSAFLRQPAYLFMSNIF